MYTSLIWNQSCVRGLQGSNFERTFKRPNVETFNNDHTSKKHGRLRSTHTHKHTHTQTHRHTHTDRQTDRHKHTHTHTHKHTHTRTHTHTHTNTHTHTHAHTHTRTHTHTHTQTIKHGSIYHSGQQCRRQRYKSYTKIKNNNKKKRDAGHYNGSGPPSPVTHIRYNRHDYDCVHAFKTPFSTSLKAKQNFLVNRHAHGLKSLALRPDAPMNTPCRNTSRRNAVSYPRIELREELTL